MRKVLKLDPGKIAQNHATRARWLQTAARARQCWKSCGNCKQPLAKTGTENVHLAVDTNGKTWGICDACLELYSTE